ncbi:ABC transporter permease [Cellulosimicrobium arenosum]|uniref:ABC transporter permease n=1 Tax=Cellulosimicrobium arenosum TaxID=2708133 RepID=A0A927G7Q7_9MICO|nr:ABC transporter permease [Cellulosimicrobium arenosum]MBD8078094.1 ABC transporter permease [Cellulosimicrobium arenosum]
MSTTTTTTVPASSPAPSPERPTTAARPPIRWRGPVVYGFFGLASLLFFAILPSGGATTTFRLATAKDFFQIEPITVSSTGAALFLSILALMLAGLAAWAAVERRKVGMWLPIVFGVLVVLAFLCWAGADKSAIPLTGLLQGSLFLAVPLVFGALSGVLCERSGIINIAIEGQLLAGAFLAAVVASLTHSAYAGLVAAPIAGALVGLLLVIFSVRYWVNQLIVGVVLNVLVVGVTSYLYSTVLTADSATWNSRTPLPVIEIPLLSQIPVLGPVLFRQTVLVYIMYVVVVVLQIMLFRSRWGLRVRAVGEHPKAADTVGIKVNRTRVRNTLLGGAIAGLGGAFFTVAAGLAFGKEMTGGKGFIALAAMILGRWNPVGALAAALLFGFSDNLQTVLGIVGTPIPSQIMLMTPYVVTIFAVAGLVGRVRPPAAEGIPYEK